jgi:hypothetical protein
MVREGQKQTHYLNPYFKKSPKDFTSVNKLIYIFERIVTKTQVDTHHCKIKA